MKATKIFIVLAATAAISLAVIGVAYGQYIDQTHINADSSYATDTDFWGWFGGCLGFGPRQAYGYTYQSPRNSRTQPPNCFPPQQPYQPQNPNQGYYSYGYRRGCWGW
jgi:hypothetical protein